jgi:hypothetical protein
MTPVPLPNQGPDFFYINCDLDIRVPIHYHSFDSKVCLEYCFTDYHIERHLSEYSW